MKRFLILPVLLLTLLVANPALSADLQKGLTAYNSGDYATALREWTPLAEQGNAGAQYNLGVMYVNGIGVPQDDKTAVKWLTFAAEQGLAVAQYNLGVMYNEGRGVPQDDKTAVKWWKLAAEQGLAVAQYNLGVMYVNGIGVPQDDKTAVKWWKLAAEQGNAAAQHNLGVMYANGTLVPQYGDGVGALVDHIRAHMWSNIAASSGYKKAFKIRDVVAEQMTPAQIAEAQKLARECVAKNYKGC